MEIIVAAIQDLCKIVFAQTADRVEKLPQSGSDKIYFRLYLNGQTYIATYNQNIKENETFLYCTDHFRSKHLPVPYVLGVNAEGSLYIQQDLGTQSLLDHLQHNGFSQATFNLYKATLSELAKIQILGDQQFDYDKCLTAKEFGKQAILSDLLYFKYYFLDTLKIAYDKQALLNDFETISDYLSTSSYKYFLFRDFQSRNVIVKNNEVHFIDYQGGMKGALQYDVASLLWQAKANLSDQWKEELLQHYISEAENLLDHKIDRAVFISKYNGFVLIRLLQVLGAYGFRGLFERKAHFLSSIPLALQNLRFYVENKKVQLQTPEFYSLLNTITDNEIIDRFKTVRATAETPLLVKISSFSYNKGCPADDTDNGGGFMFDMRGILNPGRFAEYKYLTGRDKAVQDFLEQRTKINEFLNSAFNVVDIAVEDYIKRSFASLMVSFGCTGGQHRSVYAADALARHLKNKFGVNVQVNHLVQDAKNWINQPAAANPVV